MSRMPDRLAQLLGVLSLAATDRFRVAVEGSLGRGGAHSGALVHLDAYPGESVQALARVLGVSQPAAVKIADRLAADGLLERRPGADRRTLALHLTAEGSAAAAGVLSVEPASSPRCSRSSGRPSATPSSRCSRSSSPRWRTTARRAGRLPAL